MDNRDFDKLFKHQLDGLPEDEFVFEENSWDSVEGVLEVENILPPVKRNKSGFLPLLLLGMLLLSNLLVGWKYYNAEQEITVLNTKINHLASSSDAAPKIDDVVDDNALNTSSLEQTSTDLTDLVDNQPNIKIVEKIVEKVVKEIVYVQVNPSTLKNNVKTSSSLNNGTVDSDNGNITGNSIGSISKDNSNAQNSDSSNAVNNSTPIAENIVLNEKANNNNQTITQSPSASNTNTGNNQTNSSTPTTDNARLATSSDNENNALSLQNIKSLDLIELSEIDNPIKPIHQPLENIIDTTTYKNKLKIKDYLTRIASATEVSNYELGASGGIDLLYKTTDFQPFSSRYGITSELTFSEHIKLGTTIDWKETKGELDNITTGNYPDDYFDIYPNMAGINVDDQLNKIETRDRAIEFSLFAKYIIQPHNKWSPYFGIGIKGEYDYQQRFEYKYLNDQGYEYELDYVYINNKQIGFNTLLGLAGVQYKLTPSVNVRLDAMYNYDYKAHRFDSSQMNWFSTNIGILYKFK